MWEAFAQATANALRMFDEIPSDHPIWANRPYDVLKDTPDSVHACVEYIGGNRAKHDPPPLASSRGRLA